MVGVTINQTNSTKLALLEGIKGDMKNRDTLWISIPILTTSFSHRLLNCKSHI